MSRKINSVKKTKLHNDHKVLAVRGRLSAAVEAGAGQELRLALAGIEEPVQPAGALLRIAAAVQRPLTESLFAKLKTQKKTAKTQQISAVPSLGSQRETLTVKLRPSSVESERMAVHGAWKTWSNVSRCAYPDGWHGLVTTEVFQPESWNERDPKQRPLVSGNRFRWKTLRIDAPSNQKKNDSF